jgi:hypothetical protein
MKDDFPGMDGMTTTTPGARPQSQFGQAMKPSKPLQVGDIIGVRPAGAKMIPTKAEVLSVGRSSALVKLLSPRAIELRNGNAEMTISTIGGQDIQNPYVPVAGSSTPQQSVAESHDPDDYDICSACNGSGEGMYDGSTCYKCHGSGEQAPEERDDDFDMPDDDMDDNEPESHYEKYVRTNNLESRKSGIAQGISEMSSGSVATVVNPTPKNKAKVGSLFGGTYKQKKAAK